MSMHSFVHVGCTHTVRESALEVDSGRKIPCRTWDSNPRQCFACLFGPTFYQLSYPATRDDNEKEEDVEVCSEPVWSSGKALGW